jgi:manganese/zinc/iron transport system permease protein
MNEFLLIACLACAFLSASSALMGCFLIVERKSLLGDMIGHSVLPGLCIGFVLANFEKNLMFLFIGALISALIATFLHSYLTQKSRIKTDAAMALLLTGFYACGIVLITYLQKTQGVRATGLETYLLGQASALGKADLKVAISLLISLCTLVFVFYKEIRICIFDKQFALSQDLSVRFFSTLISALISITVIFSLPAVGIILASALLILPAACATLISKNLGTRLCFSILIGLTMGFLGAYFSSQHTQIPTGPSLILTHLFLFLTLAVIAKLSKRQQVRHV